MSDVKRYTMDENSLMGGMDMFEDDDGEYVLHSDYATLRTRHNALVEYEAVLLGKLGTMEALKDRYNALVDAVKWERECEVVMGSLWFYYEGKCPYKEARVSVDAARAEVDRLIANESTADCEEDG